jgi:AIPR protein
MFNQFTNTAEGKGYIGFVQIKNYFDCLVDTEKNIKKYLFEENVRDYQGDVTVNNQILETLISPKKRDFWCLNNGVTIICSKIGQIGNTLEMENVQIVNGLQTSYKIYESIKNHSVNFTDDELLVVKVVKTEDKQLKTDIVKTTNSQTQVPTAGFRALDKIQLDIEEFFKNNDFFYDRRKNFYKNNGKPINKIISIQLLAQSIFSIIYLEPSTARSKPNSLINNNTNYTKVFEDIKNINTYLLCMKLFKNTDQKLRSIKVNINEDIKKQKKEDTKTYEIKKVVAGNFKFHVCRILASKITNTVKPDLSIFNSQIKEIDEMISDNQKLEKMILESYETLVKIVTEYLEKYKKTSYDLISISKLPTFDKVVTTHLENLEKNSTY